MRPRSLCDGKLLAVTPAVHQVKNNDHSFHAADDRPPIPPHRTPVSEQEQPPVPPRPPPMVPTRAPRAVQVPTKFRGSWPYAMTPSWNAPDPDLTPYPSPLSSADKSRCPSMAGLLNTTVPQRLAVPRPARGHHTPTRHSLRHSRMISLSQQGRVPRKYLPPVIHHHRLGTSLVVFQVFTGALLLSLALYFLLWSPQLSPRNVPHWSAVSLMVSGFFGLFLICCCRKPYPGMRQSCCVYVVRLHYITCNILLTALAAVACLCACVFASLHVNQLLTMECSETSNSTLRMSQELSEDDTSTCLCYTPGASTDQSQVFTYDPLSCYQVHHVLPFYLTTSAVANAIAVVVSVWYFVLLWNSHYAYTYAGSRVAQRKTTVMASIY